MPRAKRAVVWILADQLTLAHPALESAVAGHGQARVRVVMVESRASLKRLPYHRKRQALVLSAGRHFAAELEAAGFDVAMVAAADSRAGLSAYLQENPATELFTMQAAEHASRRWQLEGLSEDLGMPAVVNANTQFLLGRFDPYPYLAPERRIVMEHFYRAMRRQFRLLLEPDGSPTGGEWNYDSQNRKPLPRNRQAPVIPRFEPDAITRTVMGEVERSGHGVGTLDGFDLPVTRAQAEAAFADFRAHRLADFGPYEDAMSRRDGVLYHSLLSPCMNLGLLEPLAMARVVEADFHAGRVPLNSAEGFIRQIIGWREFIYWQYHRQMPTLRQANGWQAHRPLPAFFWDAQTDMACLQTILQRLLDTGFAHHIERLMVLCNFCLLTGVDPAEVADWFLALFVDSHDWVVLPNVIGMGLNADGGRTATKPYVASAAYINKMSDFCASCRFDPKLRTGPDACPYNYLYWSFLLEHEVALRSNPRLGPAVLGLKHLNAAERQAVRTAASAFLDSLAQGGLSG